MSLRPFFVAFLLVGCVLVLVLFFVFCLCVVSALLSYVAPMGKQGFGRGEVDGSILFTDNDAFMASVGFGVTGEAGTGSPGLLVGIGARLYGVNTDKSDLAALALGARFTFAPPPLPRLRIGGEVNYAPNIVTFIDGDRLFDNSVYVGNEIFQDAVAYVGVRRIKAGFENGPDVTIDKGAFLGISLHF